jgi:hypothetical protein
MNSYAVHDTSPDHPNTDTSTPAPNNDDAHHPHSSELILGTLNQDITDTFHQSIDRHLWNGIQSLPILGAGDDVDDDRTASNHGTIRNTLHQHILKKYITAVDLVELYGSRNVFSLRMIQPKSRQTTIRQLVQQYLERSNNSTNSSSNSDNAVDESSSSSFWNDVAYATTMMMADDIRSPQQQDEKDCDPTMVRHGDMDDIATLPNSTDEIPSPSDVQSMEQEIRTLRSKLQLLQQQRQRLSNDVAALQTLNENHCPTIAPLAKEIPNRLDETTAVAHTLRECQNDSHTLQERMDAMKRERDTENPDGPLDGIVHPAPTTMSMILAQPRPYKKVPPLQEGYEHDRQQLGSISTQLLTTITNTFSKKE